MLLQVWCATQRAEEEMTLLDTGWTEEQAQGLLDSLKLGGGEPAMDGAR
jgi:hypothetical protein